MSVFLKVVLRNVSIFLLLKDFFTIFIFLLILKNFLNEATGLNVTYINIGHFLYDPTNTQGYYII